jgi:hypothetical protein
MFDAWSPPSPFPSSLVANLAEEAFEELYQDIEKALDRISLYEEAIPKKTREVSVGTAQLSRLLLLPIPVFLHLVETVLGLWAVSSLPKPLHIEVCCFSEIVFWRVLYFVVKKPRLVICVVVNTV